MKDNKLLELESMIQSGECILFLGSGMSADIYPTWSHLIRKLCDRCGVAIPEGKMDDTNSLLSLADECKANDIEAYCDELKQEFAKPILTNPVKYEYVKNAPFLSFVTSNYDPLLAHNIRGLRSDVLTQIKGLDIRMLDRAVYYIHGYIEVNGDVEGDQLILSKNDFDREYDPEGPGNIRDFLLQLIKYNSVLFVGCRLSEEPLQDLLEICEASKRRAVGTIKNKHYILLPEEKLTLPEGADTSDEELREESTENKYDRYGINVVRYKRLKDDNHIELINLLEKWSNLNKPQVASPMSSGGPEL